MPTNVTPPSLGQTYLDVLNQMLDLVTQTAEAASAEKNHKLVLQAVREVTRLVTLINKISSSSDKRTASRLGPALAAPAPAASTNASGNGDKSRKTGALELFFEKHKWQNCFRKSPGKPTVVDSAPSPAPGRAAAAAPAHSWQDKPFLSAAAESEAALASGLDTK